MRLITGAILLGALFLFSVPLLVSAHPAAHAYDDSIDTNSSQGAAVNSSQLISLLSQLSKQENNTQGVPLSNDTHFQQLLSQLNASLASGNANQTASSLLRLQNYTSSAVSPGLLSSLIGSLQATSHGLTVNPSDLSSLLSVGSNGLPSGLGPGSAKEQIGDLSSLAGLLGNVNPQLAQRFLNLANDLSLNSGLPAPSGSPIPNSGGGLGGALKGLAAPSIAPAKLPGSGSISSELGLLAPPALLILFALGLFAMRGRLTRLLRGQKTPVIAEENIEPVEYDPHDPRKKILYYFYRATEQMKRRGVPKAAAETHREFSAKCEGRSGSEQVRAIGALYEKAKFSGNAVTDEDAETARAELSNLEGAETG